MMPNQKMKMSTDSVISTLLEHPLKNEFVAARLPVIQQDRSAIRDTYKAYFAAQQSQWTVMHTQLLEQRSKSDQFTSAARKDVTATKRHYLEMRNAQALKAWSAAEARLEHEEGCRQTVRKLFDNALKMRNEAADRHDQISEREWGKAQREEELQADLGPMGLAQFEFMYHQRAHDLFSAWLQGSTDGAVAMLELKELLLAFGA